MRGGTLGVMSPGREGREFHRKTLRIGVWLVSRWGEIAPIRNTLNGVSRRVDSQLSTGVRLGQGKSGRSDRGERSERETHDWTNESEVKTTVETRTSEGDVEGKNCRWFLTTLA
jgi:hypothetical protein